MGKTPAFEPKKPSGIGLKPSLWERIDRYAASRRKSRNEVIEQVLDLYIPALPDSSFPREDPSDVNLPDLFGRGGSGPSTAEAPEGPDWATSPLPTE